MALIKCPECQRDVSTTATSCPNCGAPIAAVTPSSAPAPEPKRKSVLNIVAWSIAGVLLVVAFALNQVTNDLEKKDKAEQERLQNLPDLPIEVTYRAAMIGPGLVVAFKNTSDRYLSVAATFTNPSLNQQKTFRIDLSPGQLREVGHLEGWQFASGDTISIRHNEYKPLLSKLP